jgi:hypothetical protein
MLIVNPICPELKMYVERTVMEGIDHSCNSYFWPIYSHFNSRGSNNDDGNY